jgi:hypothetical protein
MEKPMSMNSEKSTVRVQPMFGSNSRWYVEVETVRTIKGATTVEYRTAGKFAAKSVADRAAAKVAAEVHGTVR